MAKKMTEELTGDLNHVLRGGLPGPLGRKDCRWVVDALSPGTVGYYTVRQQRHTGESRAGLASKQGWQLAGLPSVFSAPFFAGSLADNHRLNCPKHRVSLTRKMPGAF